MIKRRYLLFTSSASFNRNISYLRGYFMAAASNILVGQRDFQILSVRRLSSTASSIDTSSGRFINGLSFTKFKCCSSDTYGNKFRNSDNDVFSNSNGVQKARAFGPCLPQFLCDLEADVRVEDRENSVDYRAFNGSRDGGSTNRGSSTGFPDQLLPEKIMVAVDVDEVLGNFVSALNQFIADQYSLNHSVSEYNVYEFFKIWNCSQDEELLNALLAVYNVLVYFQFWEADIRVHEFFKTSYFKKGIHPIPGSQKALQKLSKFCDLSVVTSRQNAIKEHTIEWIERHYPGLFKEIQFGNHFALDGQSRPKSDICKSLGAKVLIDDNPRYAIECAEVGIKVLLFDYENSYPWSKMESVNRHPLVTKVHNWEEVEHQLAFWITS